jgi:hypothetical protein
MTNPNNVFTLIFLMGLLSRASPTADRKLTPATPSDASIEAKQMAAQEGTSHVTELSFPKGSDHAGSKEERKLAKVIEATKKGARIGRALLVVWSDEEMPSNQGPDLNPEAVALAKRRGDVLAAYFKVYYPKIGTDFINMAERSGKVSAFLKTNDSRIREGFESAQSSTDLGKKRTGDSMASRAIVVLKVGPR